MSASEKAEKLLESDYGVRIRVVGRLHPPVVRLAPIGDLLRLVSNRRLPNDGTFKDRISDKQEALTMSIGECNAANSSRFMDDDEKQMQLGEPSYSDALRESNRKLALTTLVTWHFKDQDKLASNAVTRSLDSSRTLNDQLVNISNSLESKLSRRYYTDGCVPSQPYTVMTSSKTWQASSARNWQTMPPKNSLAIVQLEEDGGLELMNDEIMMMQEHQQKPINAKFKYTHSMNAINASNLQKLCEDDIDDDMSQVINLSVRSNLSALNNTKQIDEGKRLQKKSDHLPWNSINKLNVLNGKWDASIINNSKGDAESNRQEAGTGRSDIRVHQTDKILPPIARSIGNQSFNNNQSLTSSGDQITLEERQKFDKNRKNAMKNNPFNVFSDPWVGAYPELLERLNVMAILQADTIRLERSQKNIKVRAR